MAASCCESQKSCLEDGSTGTDQTEEVVTHPPAPDSDKQTAETLPAELWGLSMLTQTGCSMRLFVADLLTMPENKSHRGIYQFGQHPVDSVTIQGVVVAVHVKDNVFKYAVDDSTGVIQCTCWKPEDAAQTDNQLERLSKTLGEGLLSKVKELQQLHQDEQTPYELGDLLRITGSLREFRGQREIVCNDHVKLKDPNAESRWMLELPQLYKKYYDKGIQHVMPRKVVQTLGLDKGQCSEKVLQELRIQSSVQEAVVRHSHKDRQTTVQELVNASEVQEIIKSQDLCDSAVPKLIEEVVERLVSKGLLFPLRAGSSDKYHVTKNWTGLQEEVIKILEVESCKGQNFETGCSFKRLLDTLKGTVEFANITEAVLSYCLGILEESSQIITVAEDRYSVVS